MPKRSYQQLCGLARALDLVGERWTLLIVRDLAVRPRRFTDLQAGLPGIGTGLLSERLQHLEATGLARRVPAPRPAGGVLYELTDRGHELYDALMPLARWGVGMMEQPEGPEGSTAAFEAEWLVVMLRSLFHAGRAVGVQDCYEFRVSGERVWATVDDGALEVGEGDPPRPPDFVLTTDVATLAALGSHRLDPAEALATGRSVAEGDGAAGQRALEIFSAAASPVG